MNAPFVCPLSDNFLLLPPISPSSREHSVIILNFVITLSELILTLSPVNLSPTLLLSEAHCKTYLIPQKKIGKERGNSYRKN
jgi:hypothetical protein